MNYQNDLRELMMAFSEGLRSFLRQFDSIMQADQSETSLENTTAMEALSALHPALAEALDTQTATRENASAKAREMTQVAEGLEYEAGQLRQAAQVWHELSRSEQPDQSNDVVSRARLAERAEAVRRMQNNENI